MEQLENVKDGIRDYPYLEFHYFIAYGQISQLEFFMRRLDPLEIRVQSSILTNIPDDVII